MKTPSQYAQELATLNNAITTLEAQRETLLEEIRQQYPPTGETLPGGLTVSPGIKRLNTQRIEELYPHETHPFLYTTKGPQVDTKKVRANLSPAEIETNGLETIGTPRITIKQTQQP